METVARRAGVSTKTLYRLIPNKTALFEGMVSDRLDRFVTEVNLHAGDDIDIEEALCAALIACADLALDEEVIELQRMVLQEAGKFSDIAGTFYRNAIQRTVVALADWLRMQQKRGLIATRRRRRGRGHAARHGYFRAAARRSLWPRGAALALADRGEGAQLCCDIFAWVSG